MQRECELSSKNRVSAGIYLWGPLIAYLIGIFFISHLSKPTGDVSIAGFDKLLHCVEYFPAAYLFFRPFRVSSVRVISKHFIFFGIVCALLYAGLDEIHQTFIPLRNGSVMDFIADAVGVFLGAYALRRLRI